MIFMTHSFCVGVRLGIKYRGGLATKNGGMVWCMSINVKLPESFRQIHQCSAIEMILQLGCDNIIKSVDFTPKAVQPSSDIQTASLFPGPLLVPG
jgi:hypothetical protein